MRVPSCVTLQDLSAQAQPFGENVHIVDASPSKGRFPAGIAVARLTREEVETETGQRWSLKLMPLKPYEATFWGELFDGTPEVREMIMIHENSVRAPYVGIDEVLDAAQVMNAQLLLIYGYDNTNVPDTCTVSGLLYELEPRRMLANIHEVVDRAEAESAVEELLERERPEEERDWKFYIDYLAFRRFETDFRSCVWHFIDNDEESRTLRPNPFKNPEPTYPRNWRFPTLTIPGG